MTEVQLDAEGRLTVPAEVREALGWSAGQAVRLQVEGSHLRVHASAEPMSLKQEALRLATAVKGLTMDAARTVADTIASMTEPPPAGEAAPAPPGETLAAGAHVVSFQGILPRFGERVYVAPGSAVLGDVSVGDDVSIWPGAVLRGDVAAVRVGPRSNIQEGAVLHVSPHLPCVLGSRVTVGHQASIHACTIGDDTLVGIHSVVLDGARVGRHCILAAGCVVPPGMEIPDGKMVMGIPAKVVRDLTPQEVQRIHWNADSYVGLKEQYLHPAPVMAPPAAAAVKPPPPAPGTLPRWECPRATGPITIDGALDDPGWAGVPAMSALVHSNGSGAPVEATELKVCWDDQCLYLTFSCKDGEIWGNYDDRDDPLYDEEVVEFFLSPSGDPRHYFEFEISPKNVIFDAQVFNPDLERGTMRVDKAWNAPGLRTAVRVSGHLNDPSAPDLGWIVEAALPFSDLGLATAPTPGTVWRVNFYRIERGAVTEFTAWSPNYREPADFHVPEYFGELVFAG